MGFLSFILQIIVGAVVIRYVIVPIIAKHDNMRFIFPVIIYLLTAWINESSFIGVIAAVVSYFAYSFIESSIIEKKKKEEEDEKIFNEYMNAEGDPKRQKEIMSKAWKRKCEINNPPPTPVKKVAQKPQPQPTVTRRMSNVEGFQLMVNVVNDAIVRYSETEWLHDSLRHYIEWLKNHLLEIDNDIEYSTYIAVDQFDNGIYFGEMKNGKRNGYGCYMFNSGGVDIGLWSDGKKNIESIYADGNGYVEHCDYIQGKKSGYSWIRYRNGKTDNKWNK